MLIVKILVATIGFISSFFALTSFALMVKFDETRTQMVGSMAFISFGLLMSLAMYMAFMSI